MKIRIKKIPSELLNARKWNHKHQLGGPESVFDRYNTYNQQKQEYFNTLPIVNEQAGIGRIDIPEVTVTAPDPNIWWTPAQPKSLYPASGALAQDWRTHVAELAIPALWSGIPALVADVAGTLGSTKAGQYIYHGLNSIAPGTAEWTSLPAWLKFGTAAADIAFTGTQGAKTVKNPTTENMLYTALGLSPYIAGITNAAKNTNVAKRFGETAKYLWNDGKPFVRNIPYKDNNYYRIVGEDAINDAEMTGLIRGGQQFPDGPYFSKGKNVWNVEDNDYVIEGTPNIDWINAKRYNSLYQHSNFGEGVINGDNVGMPRGTQGGIQLLTGQEPVLTEAMPYYRQSTKVPIDLVTYYKRHPVIGWRKHNFQYKPQTESGISMLEKIGESNPGYYISQSHIVNGLSNITRGVSNIFSKDYVIPFGFRRVANDGQVTNQLKNFRSNYLTRSTINRVLRDNPNLKNEYRENLIEAAKNMVYTEPVDGSFRMYMTFNGEKPRMTPDGIFQYNIEIPRYDRWSNLHEIGHFVDDATGLPSSNLQRIPGYRYSVFDESTGTPMEQFADMFANKYSRGRLPYDIQTHQVGQPWSLQNRIGITKNYILDDDFQNIIRRFDGQIVKNPTKIKVELKPQVIGNTKKIVHTLD